MPAATSSASTASAVLTPPALLRDGVSAWVATLVACLCAFMVVMDGAIVNIALSAMRDDLHLSTEQQQWIIDIYLLMLGGFMLLAARAGDLYGRRRLLLWGLVLFTGASLAGGLAASGPVLLAARALQGFGASVLATSPLALIVAAHPKGPGQERAIGLWAACAAMGSAFGVVAGGLLTSLAGWRWVMFVNVPAGILLAALVLFGLRPQAPAALRVKLDLTGAITITLALASLLFAVSASAHSGWNAFPVQGAVAMAAIMFVAFIAAERHAEHPLIPFSIFRIPNVSIGMLMVMGLGAALTASMFFLSLALQRIDGRSAFDTGLTLLPMAVALGIAAIASRPLREAGFTRLPLMGGLIAAGGLIWLYWLPAHPSHITELLIPTILIGAGNGLVMMSATHATLAGVPRKDAGLAAGLQNTARQLGGAIGIAVLVSLAHAVMASGIDAGDHPLAAELNSYRCAFLVTGMISLASALLSLLLKTTVRTEKV